MALMSGLFILKNARTYLVDRGAMIEA